MADNVVEIRIKATDTAKPDITALKLDLDELGSKIETARVDVDDADGKAKLLAFNAQLAAVGKRLESPRITVAGAARAEAQLAAIDAGLGHLGDKSKEVSDKVSGDVQDVDGKLSDLGRTAGLLSKGGGLLSRIFYGADGVEGSTESGFSGLTGIISKIPESLLAIVPAVEAALPEVTGLVSGFAAAGTGAGAFALLAIPAVESVKTAYSNLNTAMSAYSAAKAKEASDPSVANESALKAALANVNQVGAAIQKLPADEQGALDGIYKLQRTWQSMAKAFEPDVFKVFNDGLRIANNLLPEVTPFADTFASHLDKLLQQAGKFTDSKGFKDWLAQFQKLEGPSIDAIGNGIGKVANAAGKLLTTMSGKDDAHAITIAFDAIADTIKTVAYMVHTLMTNWDAMSSAFRKVRHDLSADTAAMREDFVHFGHDVESAFDGLKHSVSGDIDSMREDFVRFGHNLESSTDSMREHFIRFGHDVEAAFGRVRHDVAAVGDAIVHGLEMAGTWITSRWREITAWLVDPIGMAVYEIRTHTHEIAAAFDAARHGVAAAIGGMRHDISSDFDSMRHDIAAAADWIPNEIKKAFDNGRKSGNSAIDGLRHDLAADWDNMRHDLASFADWVPHEIASLFDTARHNAAAAIAGARHDLASDYDSMRGDIESFVAKVVSYFGSLPGKILSALSKLPGDMESAGRNIIDGLIRGIESAAADIPSIMEGLAKDVESYFTNPLKMFSPSRVFIEHGQNIVQGAVIGVQSAAPRLRSAMQQLGRQVASTGLGYGAAGIGGAGAGGAGGTQRIQLEFTGGGGDDLVKWLRNQVRVKGGNVQAVLGH